MKVKEVVEGGFYVQKKRPNDIRYVWRIDDNGVAHWLGFDANSGEYYGVDFAWSVQNVARLAERRLSDEEASKMKLEQGVKRFKAESAERAVPRFNSAGRFGEMSGEQQWAMIIAQYVRNALECFHAGDDGIIPQSAMPELNRRVRRAVLEAVYALMHVDQPGCNRHVAITAATIPGYWEAPELLPEEKALLEEGHSRERYAAYEAVEHQIEAWFKTGQMDG